MKTIALFNNKGGVGKTTSVINIAYILAEVMKKKVLVIDCDGQQNTSRFFTDALNEDGFEKYMISDFSFPCDIIQNTRYENIDVLSSSEKMNYIIEDFYKLSVEQREANVNRIYKAFEDKYDYVLMDMPPALNIITETLLSITDGVVVPIELSSFSIQGIAKVTDTINKVGSSFVGSFITKYDKDNNSDKDFMRIIDAELGDKNFKSVIPYSKIIRNSLNYKVTAYEYMHWLSPVQKYVELTEEIIRKVG